MCWRDLFPRVVSSVFLNARMRQYLTFGFQYGVPEIRLDSSLGIGCCSSEKPLKHLYEHLYKLLQQKIPRTSVRNDTNLNVSNV